MPSNTSDKTGLFFIAALIGLILGLMFFSTSAADRRTYCAAEGGTVVGDECVGWEG